MNCALCDKPIPTAELATGTTQNGTTYQLHQNCAQIALFYRSGIRICPAKEPAMERPLSHYIVVRGDLPKGCIVAQAVHAAAESVNGPVPGDTHAVVLQADNESELLMTAGDLAAACVPHKVIIETDGGFAGQAMALGVRPSEKSAIAPLLKHLKVYR